MQLEREAAVAREAAQSAGEIIALHAGGPRESWQKGEDSPVTRADLDANRAICERLAAAFPDDPILSEETAASPERTAAERLWIVDPLDGTKEFIAGIPEFAVSIALALRGEPVVGVVHQPLVGECFWGIRGEGAFLGDARLRVSRASRLEDCVLLSSRTEERRGQLRPYAGWFRELVPVGSVALKLAHVAAARGDVWISLAPKSEWDVCAGDLLVHEAGGELRTAAGPRLYNRADVLLQPPMAAGPRPLVEAFLARDAGRAHAAASPGPGAAARPGGRG